MRALGRKGDGDNTAGEAAGMAESAPDALDLDLGEIWLEEAEPAEQPTRFGWIAPTLAVLAAAAWTAFFGWAHSPAILARPAPDLWATLLVQWSVPVALIGIVWLLAMRSSRAEARRFAAAAAMMNQESAALEERLKVVNRELSLAREFLAAQSRDLESLGRIAAERISTHAAELQTLITSNGAQVDAIGATSDTALGNMNRLREDLPVIANAARDVANQIGGAGRNAQEQLERMVSGFERLNTFGTASEAQVRSLGTRVGETLTGFEDQLGRIEALVGKRFVALQSDAEAYRAQLDTLEAEALSALGERARQTSSEAEALAAKLRTTSETVRVQLEESIASLHAGLVEKLRLVDEIDQATGAASQKRIEQLRAEVADFEQQMAERSLALGEQIEQRQAAFETHEAQASEVLAQRLSALDDALAQRREAQIADTNELLVHGEAIVARLDELGRLMDAIGQQGVAARESLAAGLGSLGEQLAEKRAALAETEVRLSALTESGIRLLEIIQSGARATREDLPAAIVTAQTALSAAEARAENVNQLMLQSSQQGSDLSEYLLNTRSEIDAAEGAIARFKDKLAEGSEDALARLQGLRGGFARLAEESGALATSSQEQLRDALGMLENAITHAFETLDQGAREKTISLAQTIGGEAVEALERSLRSEAAATIGKLEQAAAHASGVGREATIQLRDQLVRVNELTGNLEQRVAHARELAEEQVNNDFSRRMALITDSLNSAAIDITSALSTEVTDTAWDAYLKGDRGIFTRRAVRLIDNGTAKDIAALYGEDETFKANVSRYIHDFEAMLRAMLSTRDGHVLSVTVLGSEMGKLYVALAQAIQRFRN
ncbi:ATPase [Porphyrobacter sp. AAP60]|uniref:ATPase n=1 Tax=Porphyrobacter sp. AAP60 TaxID=1523423 RepID=UPI000AC7CB3C|nr:ATPase [Porphyrobacter sp. AAP60]